MPPVTPSIRIRGVRQDYGKKPGNRRNAISVWSPTMPLVHKYHTVFRVTRNLRVSLNISLPVHRSVSVWDASHLYKSSCHHVSYFLVQSIDSRSNVLSLAGHHSNAMA